MKIVVVFPPGGGTDAVSRHIANAMAESMKQSVIVENKPGGSTSIGSDHVAKSAPDGYTLLVTSVPLVTNPSLQKNLPYDTVKAFAPICRAVDSPFVLAVAPSSPIQSLKDLAALGSTRKLTFGSAGNGTADHLGMELLAIQQGVPMVHAAYKGSAPAMADLMGGHIDLMFANAVAVAPHLKAGKLRGIAVSSAKRSFLLPDMPTLQELGGKPFDVTAWTGFLAPAGTDPAIVELLSAEIRKALQVSSVREFVLKGGGDPVATTPADFSAFIEREIPIWADIVRQAKLA